VAETWGFAPPPFKPDEALQRARRELRDAGLTEREGRFERRGLAVAQLSLVDHGLRWTRVKRPSRNSPEWLSPQTLTTSAALRDALADLKKNLAAWSDSDD
jgi:hypothetical protein